MDFHNMKRKQLQALCKKHKIPANLSNSHMALNLSSLLLGKEKKSKRDQTSSKVSVESVQEQDSGITTRQSKKVRFSPNNEMFEYVKLSSGRKMPTKVTQTKSVMKPAPKKRVNPVVVKGNIKLSKEEVVGKTVRSLRSKVQASVAGGVIPLVEMKQAMSVGIQADTAVKTVRVTRSKGKASTVALVPVTKQQLKKKRSRGVVKDVDGVEPVEEVVPCPVRVTRSRVQTSVEGGEIPASKPQVEKKRCGGLAKDVEPVEEVVACPVRVTRSRVQTSVEGGEIPALKPQVEKKKCGGLAKDVEPVEEVVACPVRVTRSRVQTSVEGGEIPALKPQVEKKRRRGLAKDVESVEEVVALPVRVTRSRVQTSVDGGEIPALKPQVEKKRRGGLAKDVEPAQDVVDSPVRTTRSRAQTSKEGCKIIVHCSPVEKKRARTGIRVGDRTANSTDVVSQNADRTEDFPLKRSLRKRDVDVKGVQNVGQKNLKQKTAKGIDEIIEDVPLATEGAELGLCLKRSTRNGVKVKDSKVLNSKSGETEMVGQGNRPRSRNQLTLKENSDTKTEAGVIVRGKSKVLLQADELLGRTGRNSNWRKSVMHQETGNGVKVQGVVEVVLKLEEPAGHPTRKGGKRKSVMPNIDKIETADQILGKGDILTENEMVVLPASPLRRSRCQTSLLESVAPTDEDMPSCDIAGRKGSHKQSFAVCNGKNVVASAAGNNTLTNLRGDFNLQAVDIEGSLVKKSSRRFTRSATKDKINAAAGLSEKGVGKKQQGISVRREKGDLTFDEVAVGVECALPAEESSRRLTRSAFKSEINAVANITVGKKNFQNLSVTPKLEVKRPSADRNSVNCGLVNVDDALFSFPEVVGSASGPAREVIKENNSKLRKKVNSSAHVTKQDGAKEVYAQTSNISEGKDLTSNSGEISASKSERLQNDDIEKESSINEAVITEKVINPRDEPPHVINAISVCELGLPNLEMEVSLDEGTSVHCIDNIPEVIESTVEPSIEIELTSGQEFTRKFTDTAATGMSESPNLKMAVPSEEGTSTVEGAPSIADVPEVSEGAKSLVCRNVTFFENYYSSSHIQKSGTGSHIIEKGSSEEVNTGILSVNEANLLVNSVNSSDFESMKPQDEKEIGMEYSVGEAVGVAENVNISFGVQKEKLLQGSVEVLSEEDPGPQSVEKSGLSNSHKLAAREAMEDMRITADALFDGTNSTAVDSLVKQSDSQTNLKEMHEASTSIHAQPSLTSNLEEISAFKSERLQIDDIVKESSINETVIIEKVIIPRDEPSHVINAIVTTPAVCGLGLPNLEMKVSLDEGTSVHCIDSVPEVLESSVEPSIEIELSSDQEFARHFTDTAATGKSESPKLKMAVPSEEGTSATEGAPSIPDVPEVSGGAKSLVQRSGNFFEYNSSSDIKKSSTGSHVIEKDSSEDVDTGIQSLNEANVLVNSVESSDFESMKPQDERETEMDYSVGEAVCVAENVNISLGVQKEKLLQCSVEMVNEEDPVPHSVERSGNSNSHKLAAQEAMEDMRITADALFDGTTSTAGDFSPVKQSDSQTKLKEMHEASTSKHDYLVGGNGVHFYKDWISLVTDNVEEIVEDGGRDNQDCNRLAEETIQDNSGWWDDDNVEEIVEDGGRDNQVGSNLTKEGNHDTEETDPVCIASTLVDDNISDIPHTPLKGNDESVLGTTKSNVMGYSFNIQESKDEESQQEECPSDINQLQITSEALIGATCSENEQDYQLQKLFETPATRVDPCEEKTSGQATEVSGEHRTQELKMKFQMPVLEEKENYTSVPAEEQPGEPEDDMKQKHATCSETLCEDDELSEGFNACGDTKEYYGSEHNYKSSCGITQDKLLTEVPAEEQPGKPEDDMKQKHVTCSGTLCEDDELSEGFNACGDTEEYFGSERNYKSSGGITQDELITEVPAEEQPGEPEDDMKQKHVTCSGTLCEDDELSEGFNVCGDTEEYFDSEHNYKSSGGITQDELLTEVAEIRGHKYSASDESGVKGELLEPINSGGVEVDGLTVGQTCEEGEQLQSDEAAYDKNSRTDAPTDMSSRPDPSSVSVDLSTDEVLRLKADAKAEEGSDVSAKQFDSTSAAADNNNVPTNLIRGTTDRTFVLVDMKENAQNLKGECAGVFSAARPMAGRRALEDLSRK